MGKPPDQRRASRQDRLAASSIWARWALVVILAAPWMLTVQPALFGNGAHDFAPLVILVGAFVGNSLRDQAFLRLPAESRRKVIAVRRSGDLTGDRTLDAIGFNRVQRAARSARLDRILLPILVAIYVTSPVVAAVRDTPWWVFCLLPGAIVAAAIPAIWPPEDPRVQLDRLLHPVGAA